MRNLGELTGLNLASISLISPTILARQKGSANKLIAFIVINWRLVVCSVHALSFKIGKISLRCSWKVYTPYSRSDKIILSKPLESGASSTHFVS